MGSFRDKSNLSITVIKQFKSFREAVLAQTINSEDQEATTITAENSPKRKTGPNSNKLTQALNQLRMQTARNSQPKQMRNEEGFRTVASTPKSRKFSFANEISESLMSPKNGHSATIFK